MCSICFRVNLHQTSVCASIFHTLYNSFQILFDWPFENSDSFASTLMEEFHNSINKHTLQAITLDSFISNTNNFFFCIYCGRSATQLQFPWPVSVDTGSRVINCSGTSRNRDWSKTIIGINVRLINNLFDLQSKEYFIP